MMDPRLSVIEERLSKVNRVIAVASGKGGVGKSVISTGLSLLLAKKGYHVGLLDLDFYGPSCHLILGVDKLEIIEDKGVVPPTINGIKFMSITHFSEDKPVAMRGKDVSNAIIELLSITRWGPLDYLIIDLPPGIGDEALDTIRLMKTKEFLIVTTPSKLSIGVVAKLINFLKEIKAEIIGIVENMTMDKSNVIYDLAGKHGVRYLGRISFDRDLERCLGTVECLMKTKFIYDLQKILEDI